MAWSGIVLYSIKVNFNPHSDAGSDAIEEREKYIEKISIHTPTQGVTHSAADSMLGLQISIHTPTQGVTFWLSAQAHDNEFQSTLPRRE